MAFRNNETVFSQRDAANKVFYIQNGKVKVAVMSEQGKETLRLFSCRKRPLVVLRTDVITSSSTPASSPVTSKASFVSA